jgi:hypothetical protein
VGLQAHRCRRRRTGAWVPAALLVCAMPLCSAAGQPSATTNYGPYNAVFLAGGVGLSRPLAADSPLLRARAPWSLSGWLRLDRSARTALVVAAIGDEAVDSCRCLVVESDRLALRVGPDVVLTAGLNLERGSWHAVAATYDGQTARLYADGAEQAARIVTTAAVAPLLRLAPEDAADPAGEHHFGGALALFSVSAQPLTAAQVSRHHDSAPDFALIPFHQVGVGWPWQEHAWRGLQEPQPAWTLPHANALSATPIKSLSMQRQPPLRAIGGAAWSVGDWHLAPASQVHDAPASVSAPDFREDRWWPAVVPGTVLTTLIANGVYPDPDIGLNNLAIPESLNRESYWYRSRFTAPPARAGQRLTLTFQGINYGAEVWLNGIRIGTVRGAFIRGVFDVTAAIRPDADNALAVLVSPPPHPGIPHEQSVAAGPGENGGSLAIDGPTFIATEGWDWIPAIRDRNTGIWQDVELSSSGAVRLLDPQVTTRLPLPRTDSAELAIRVAVDNTAPVAVRAVIEASLDGRRLSTASLLPSGRSEVLLDAAEFPQLRLDHPRLWWPNGYGSPELYALRLAVTVDGLQSDEKAVRFGVRQITYDLSLFDRSGALRRVEVDPTDGSAHHERLVDVRHEAIKRTATGWAASLTVDGETSAAVRDVPTAALTPYLTIRVNGVAIAARGGSWGMDDSRKRVSRARLEPFFRLHRQAHLNIIRNWLGQNTEEVFYDLADEYGLLVLNDFWASTQDFQVEPQDPQLFLANARDVVRRFRNHPSIAVWFGRNEGVPPPVINEGLADLVAEEDGTRYYTGSSNSVNLQASGPYDWRPPEQYFTSLAHGFSVEVGTPSLASLESLQAMIPEPDRWPLGDSYAYHDWHFGGNGDTASFMRALERGLGPASGLEDFERKAQLMNYVSYRAIFEGFQAQLWTRNSGRLLWMTHPAWPSNAWQIYSADYDAAAAYYAVATACEPLHAQLNLPDFRPAVVNTGRERHRALRLTSRLLSLDGRVLASRTDRLDAAANAVVTLEPLAIATHLAAEGIVVVALALTDAGGAVLSRNVYWQSRSESEQRRLTTMAPARLSLQARGRTEADESVVSIEVRNIGTVPALQSHLTALDPAGERVLPAYYSDNYLSVLPGELRSLTVRCPRTGRSCARITLRGWNVPPQTVTVAFATRTLETTSVRSTP